MTGKDGQQKPRRAFWSLCWNQFTQHHFGKSKCAVVLSHSLVFPILKPHELQPTRLLCPRYSPGKNTGVGCHCLLQDIFPTQELNMSLLHLLLWQEDSLPLCHLGSSWSSYVDLIVIKRWNEETLCWSNDWDSMAPHSSILAWKIPWTEEPGGLQFMGSLRVGHDWATSLWLFTFMHWRRQWQPTPVFLPGESQGRGSLMGCRLWGRTESDTTEAT